MSHTYARVLVGVDGSPTAAAAAERAIAEASAHGAELHIVDVVPVPTAGTAIGQAGAAALAAAVAKNDKQASKALLDVQHQAIKAGLTSVTHLEHGEPAQAILATSTRVGASLIVVGSRGIDGAGRYVLGSVPEHVLLGATCDVLIVRTA